MLLAFDISHIDGIAPIIGLVVVWVIKMFSQAVSKSKEKEEMPSATNEQTRRVQDDIRRKIAERRTGAAPVQRSQPSTRVLPPPIVAPRPVSAPLGGEPSTLRDLLAKRVRDREAADAKRSADAVAAKQADQDATDFAIAMPVAPSAPTAPVRGRTYLGVPDAKTRSAAISNLNEDLKDPERLRRAFVLRDILSSPVALR